MIYFQHSVPCSPFTSPIDVELLFPWCRSLAPILILEKILKRPDTASKPCFFHVREQKRVTWCQIRRIWRVVNKFKATFTHSGHYNHRIVCRSNVLVKQDSYSLPSRLRNASYYYFSKSYSSVGLSGRKQRSLYQEELNLMHAKFPCCGTTP